MNTILKSIKDYGELTYKEVVWYAEMLTELFQEKEICPDHFFLQEMKKAMKGIEDFKTDRQIKMAESVIRDLRKTLNQEPVFSTQLYVSPERSKLEWKGTLGVCDRIEEFEADVAEMSRDLASRAKELADTRPDLVEAVDKGEKTIGGAYQQMCKEDQGAKAVSGDPDSVSPVGANKADDFICEERVDVPFYEPYRPGSEPAPGNVRTVKGADHEHLLENPIYSRLYESYNDAVQQVNLARGELRTRCEGYERRIRGYAENIQTMQREIARLREALHA